MGHIDIQHDGGHKADSREEAELPVPFETYFRPEIPLENLVSRFRSQGVLDSALQRIVGGVVALGDLYAGTTVT